MLIHIHIIIVLHVTHVKLPFDAVLLLCLIRYEQNFGFLSGWSDVKLCGFYKLEHQSAVYIHIYVIIQYYIHKNTIIIIQV